MYPCTATSRAGVKATRGRLSHFARKKQPHPLGYLAVRISVETLTSRSETLTSPRPPRSHPGGLRARNLTQEAPGPPQSFSPRHSTSPPSRSPALPSIGLCAPFCAENGDACPRGLGLSAEHGFADAAKGLRIQHVHFGLKGEGVRSDLPESWPSLILRNSSRERGSRWRITGCWHAHNLQFTGPIFCGGET